MFDALHTIGAAIFLAHRYRATVTVSQAGVCRQLSIIGQIAPRAFSLNEVLRLPDIAALTAKVSAENAAAWGNFDGLLALLFTSRGARVVSAADLQSRMKQRETLAASALKKVSKAIERWSAYLQKRQISWDDIDRHYRQPQPIVFIKKLKPGLGLQMTIDPALSYAHRSAISNGLVADKYNITTQTPFIPVLASIGAARALRAQRTAGRQVNYYVPIPDEGEIDALWTLPSLPGTSSNSTIAALTHWLSTLLTPPFDLRRAGLTFQVLQTQGIQQSISIDRGMLNDGWLQSLQAKTGDSLLRIWQRLLWKNPGATPIEGDVLAEALLRQRSDAWLSHLQQVAEITHHSKKPSPVYSIRQAQEVFLSMNMNTQQNPLGKVLETDTGTVRFGKALRLLARFNPSIVRELVEQLDSVRERNALIRALAQSVQECGVAKAKSEFIIVPDDNDLAPLLADIDRYGVKTVVNLIIMLSALRYPRAESSTEAKNGNL